jgi:serine/threonine protein kinase
MLDPVSPSYADTGHYSLDSSDTGITTTAGPPSHSTRRYSAPEVFDQSQRSRLTDIWSLGCVLADILSRLLGHKLDAMKTFWCSNGSKFDSYAENTEATTAWFTNLAKSTAQAGGQHQRSDMWLISFVGHILLERDRLKRPTAEQVLARLISLYSEVDIAPTRLWIGACCVPLGQYRRPSSDRWSGISGPAFDTLRSDSHLQAIIVDPNLQNPLNIAEWC